MADFKWVNVMAREAVVFWPLLFAGFEQEIDENADTGSPTPGDSSAPGYQLEVAADGGSASVDLSDLAAVDLAGETVVALTAVLDASGCEVTWADRTYDFEASDGYRPSANDCGPSDWTTIQGGYIYPETGNLTWDEGLGMLGCLFVDGVVLMDVLDG